MTLLLSSYRLLARKIVSCSLLDCLLLVKKWVLGTPAPIALSTGPSFDEIARARAKAPFAPVFFVEVRPLGRKLG